MPDILEISIEIKLVSQIPVQGIAVFGNWAALRLYVRIWKKENKKRKSVTSSKTEI